MIFAAVHVNLAAENPETESILPVTETNVHETEEPHVHLIASVNYACKGSGCTCDGFEGSFSGKYPMANACYNCGHRRDWHTKLAKSGGSTSSASSNSNSNNNRCNTCRGTGKCQRCNGKGTYYNDGHYGPKKSQLDRYVKCDRCNGSGKCSYCRGTGNR